MSDISNSTSALPPGVEIRDTDELIALCVDCGTTQNEERAGKSAFLQAGLKGVCSMCSGPVVVIPASAKDRILEKRARGEAI